ncbi:nitrogen permease regulator 2-domain-containing protein [Dimargaris cristalligena]|uniref:Nitrogen permease regulator 2-domain-containing protein n=1 Tax=Dimargaris cristalligena TaxID=215637 RepID=A0A4P9ZNS2_9FUNG|nr:nitrogen permease regulator 2-domain-containing protein [Dimargaris cristalligena]|eukprot:RKP34987.1 nitrogen permease regulator 2-domain-containing protein [Dimargaris cristalligena]
MEKPFFTGFPQILCIFYAEFDIDIGPVVRYEIPEGFGPSFSSASRSGLTLFDQAADFLIPQAELKRRFVTYYTEKYKILGYPVAISGPQYRRNELTFNCAFVFRRSDKTECFEPVIRKIAELVEHMEHGIEFLVSPHKKSRLPAILAQLYLDLNQFNESRVVYPPWFDLNLKLFPTLKNPPYIYDYEVPVLVSDLAKVINNMWDMTLVNVLERINGVFHLKKIAEQCNIDLELVRSCVQHLLYYECVVLADIFKFTNIYALTADVVDTIWKTVNQEEFVAFVALPEAKPPTFHDAIRLYFDLKPGLTVARWLEKSGIASANIDIRRFLIFGQVKKLIYRIHKYPVSLHPSACFPSNVSRLFNGRYHLDAICTQLNASEAEMEEYCGKDPNLHIIYK